MEHNSMSELLEATIFSIEKRKSKAGNAAIQVTCIHQDGSQWGMRIRDWINHSTEYAHVWTRWGHLVKPNCNADTAKEILTGDNYDLIGLEVQVEVEDGDFGKRVKNVFLKGAEIPEKPIEVVDDIPF
tara:strand:- start:304 stop:687 length:384 start_codon:yes stop_codon:yes gene_type:complete